MSGDAAGSLSSDIPLVAAARGRPGQVAFIVPTIGEGIRMWGASGHTQAGWKVWTYGPDMVSNMTYRGCRSDHSMILAMSGVDPQIELIQPLDGPSIYHDWIRERGHGFHHFGLYVDDVDAVTPSMEDAGYPMVQSGRGMGADGSGAYAYFDTTDRLGIYLEAIEVPVLRRPPQWILPEQ